MCTITYGNVETKYPINIINFSDGLKLKYWIVDGEYHIALWDGEHCIVKDEDGAISFVLQCLVRIVHKYYGLKLDYEINEKKIKELENDIQILREKLKRRLKAETPKCNIGEII